MSKELAKTYDPKGHRGSSVSEMAGQEIFPCRSKPEQETVYHCDAAAKRNRTASYGPCTGQHHAGYPDPFQENAGL